MSLEDTSPVRTIAVVIPVYNEAGRIGQVLSVLRKVTCLKEIIVVDDGSTDGTLDEVNQCATLDARIRALSHANNRGKGQAVHKGMNATRATYLLMLDGDLVDLQPDHIYDLIGPVIAGVADMTLGLFRGGRYKTDLSHWFVPWLTGQRCLHKDLFRYVSLDAAAGYGIETAITVASRQHRWRCQQVILRGVDHPPSEFHRGAWPGIKMRAKMNVQILRAFYLASRWNRLIRRIRIRMQFGKLQ